MTLSGLRRMPKLFWLVGALYVLPFPYHPNLRSPNELCRLWQTRALVEYGTLDINLAIRDYGYVGDLSRFEGRLYPSKAPLLSFAAVPIYAALRALGGGYRYAVGELALVYCSRLFLTVAPTLFMLVLVWRFLRAYVSERMATDITATYALGSLAYSYSLLFMSHQTTAVLLFASFFALWRCARGEWRERGYLVAGAAAGAAVAAEYTGAMAVLALVLFAALTFFFREEPMPLRLRGLARAAGLATLGALPFVFGLMAYHSACFGGPLESGYKHLNDAGYQPWHLGGFLGIRYPDPRAFALSFFSPLRGLFALSPFLLLFFPGMGVVWQASKPRTLDRALFWLSAAMFLGYAYFTSSFSYESWGWTTGPRHMTGLVPFLLLPIALWFERLKLGEATHAFNGLLGVSAGLCFASILVTGALSLVDYVPDNVTGSFFGLAVPLFTDGFLPPSVLGLWIPNPVSGAIILLLLALAAVATFADLIGAFELPRLVTRVGLASFAGFAACALFLGALASVTQHSPGDLGAQNHLKSVWLMPPGVTISFR